MSPHMLVHFRITFELVKHVLTTNCWKWIWCCKIQHNFYFGH